MGKAKDDGVYVKHMLEHARKAVEGVNSRGRRAFDEDELLRQGLTRLVQIIGEAARRISPEYCQAHPEIPWTAIVGMRNKVVHDYLSVDSDRVWDTITLELPPLIEQLERLLAKGGK